MDKKSVVAIDELNLDKECISLPQLILRYSMDLANARKSVSEAKARLEVCEAEIANEIRSTPEKYGIEKVTNDAIKQAMIALPKYQKFAGIVIDRQLDYDMTGAVVSALDAKRKSLSLLVDLLGMSYFSAPKISERGRDAVNNMTKEKVRRAGRED